MGFDWKEFQNTVLNGASPTYLIAHMCLAMVGAFINLTFESSARSTKTSSSEHPKKYSFLYLIKDNLKRIFNTFMLMILAIIFFEPLNGAPLTPFSSVILGMSVDNLAWFIKLKRKRQVEQHGWVESEETTTLTEIKNTPEEKTTTTETKSVVTEVKEPKE